MQLCTICNAANSNSFETGKCFICEDAVLRLPGMIDSAVALLKSESISSFSISSLIPKEWLIKEEFVWDRLLDSKSQSLKQHINRTIISGLTKLSSLKCHEDGDCRVIFDLANGTTQLARNDLFLFGRYKKYVTGISQSRWMCSDCEGTGCDKCKGKGKHYESVEERIGEPAKLLSKADHYVLHASGREDVDATNIAGRGFVLEIKNPKIRKIDLAILAKKIASSGEVSVSDLQFVKRSFVELVTESHFDKSYDAIVEFGRSVSSEDAIKIQQLSGQMINQFTPSRVAHRRANLIRNRRIKSILVSDIRNNTARLSVTAEAGTYIKELISGDDGRTKPSVAELLGTGAICKQLIVTNIDDKYVDFCRFRLTN